MAPVCGACAASDIPKSQSDLSSYGVAIRGYLNGYYKGFYKVTRGITISRTVSASFAFCLFLDHVLQRAMFYLNLAGKPFNIRGSSFTRYRPGIVVNFRYCFTTEP